MLEIKYAVCLASYSIGTATEYSHIQWLGSDGWVCELEDALFFVDCESAKNAILWCCNEEFSIVKVSFYIEE